MNGIAQRSVQRPRGRRTTAVAFVLAAACVLAACGDDDGAPRANGATTDNATVTVDTGPDPRIALSDLLDRARIDETFRRAGFRDATLVTQRFAARVDALSQGPLGLEFDPFLCAQNVPDSIELDEPAVSRDSATIDTRQTYGAGPAVTLTYRLRLEEGTWKLDSNDCVS